MAVAAKASRSQSSAVASTLRPKTVRTKRSKSTVQAKAAVQRKPIGDEEANRRSGLLAGGAGVQRKAVPEEEQVQRKPLGDEEKVQRKTVPEEEKVQRKPEDYLEDKKKARADAAGKTVQASSFISSPEDASEREADRVADAVTAPRATSATSAAASPPVGRSIMRASREDEGGKGPPVAAANDNVEAKIKAAAVGGKPLSRKTRALLEPRFGADFSDVRIHDDDQAGKLSSRIGARAFTYGRHVFFNAGQYQPDTPSGQKLLAHELTHTIQQRAAVQRKYDGLTSGAKVSEATGNQASRLGISDALDYFADAAYNIPGYRMFTIMIGLNPINMREVEATTANILRAIVEFLPGGGLITTVLDQWGIFDTVGTWVDEQLKTLGISGTSIKAALDEFLESLGWSDALDLDGVWARAVSIFSTPIDRVITFIGSLFTQILEFVQQAVLAPLAALVSETEGYGLLTQILGFDPITGAPVERTAEGIVGGLLTLAGQEELWNNIQEANALDRIWEWFGTALDGLIALVMGIPDRFIEALATIEITEFLDLPAAILKVLGVFGTIVIDFGTWILNTVFTLLTIIIDVVAPGLMGYLEKAGKAFDTIVNDPIGFVSNLVNAAKLGLSMFVDNFVPNLKQALVGWLTGALAGANLHIPKAFTVQEILKFVLSVLGLTWDNIRTKLVREIGETAVGALETGFELVQTLIVEGPAAAWEQIVESIGNLRDMVIDQVIDFVMDRVITAAVTRLVSFLNPAGALVQAIIAIYNTIMFFVERLSQMAQVAAAFIDSIADIASGKIEPAATKVEQTMVGLLSLVVSFLARLVGLGNVGEAITGLIDRLRRPIDEALDKVVVWIVTQARRLGDAIMGRNQPEADDNRTPEEKQRDLDIAATELRPRIDRLLATEPSEEELEAQIAIWKTEFRLTELSLEGHNLIAKINPEITLAEGWKFEDDTKIIAAIDRISGEIIEAGRQSLTGTEVVEEERTVQEDRVRTVQQVDVRSARAGSGAASAQYRRQEFLIGNTASGDVVAAGRTNEQRVYGPGFWIGIGAGGAGGEKGRLYGSLAAAAGAQRVGDWMRLLIRRQSLPEEAAQHQGVLEELYGLFMIHEPAHGRGEARRDLGYSLMAVDLMTGDDGLPVSDIVGANALHPAAFGRAQPGRRAVDLELAGGPESTSPSGVERSRRERAIIVAWFARHQDQLPVLDREPTVQDVEDFIRERFNEIIDGR